MDKDELAQILWDTLDAPPLTENEEGYPGPRPPNKQIKNYADGFVSCLKAGVCNILAGLVNGSGPPGGTMTGDGQGGLLTLVAALMIAKSTADTEHPIAIANLTIENTVVITYMQTASVVAFAAQEIGQNTATAVTPGILANGVLSDGTISGPTGSVLATLVAPLGPRQQPFYTALVNYYLNKARVNFAEGTVQGTVPAPPGTTLAGGFALGGSVS